MTVPLSELGIGDAVYCAEPTCTVDDHTGTVVGIDGTDIEVQWFNGGVDRSIQPRQNLRSERDVQAEKARRTREKKRAKYRKGKA